MKQLITCLSFLLTCCISANAQEVINHISDDYLDRPTRLKISDTQEEVNEFFNYGYSTYLFYDNVESYRIDLFPDSNVMVHYGDYWAGPWKHSVGQVLDPMSPLFGIEYPEVNQYTSYHVDSIVLPYRYYRTQNEFPDTLLVQYYEPDNMFLIANAGFPNINVSYSRIYYNWVKRRGAAPAYEFKYLLTEADTNTSLGYLGFEVDRHIPAGGKFAVTFTYFPGNPYETGDTLDPIYPTVTNEKINDFAVFEFKDEDFVIGAGDYNHSLDVPTSVRYNINQNGWNGRYLPGSAWATGIYQMDVYFKINYEPNSIKEADGSGFLIYPNPANDFITIQAEGNSLIKSTYQVYNTMGQLVLSGSFSGQTNNTIDISVLETGIYTIRLLDEDNMILRSFSKL